MSYGADYVNKVNFTVLQINFNLWERIEQFAPYLSYVYKKSPVRHTCKHSLLQNGCLSKYPLWYLCLWSTYVAIDIIVTKANYIVTILNSHSSTWCNDGFTTLQTLLKSITISVATSVHPPLNTEHNNSEMCIYMAAVSIELCIYFDDWVSSSYKRPLENTETIERL